MLKKTMLCLVLVLGPTAAFASTTKFDCTARPGQSSDSITSPMTLSVVDGIFNKNISYQYKSASTSEYTAQLDGETDGTGEDVGVPEAPTTEFADFSSTFGFHALKVEKALLTGQKSGIVQIGEKSMDKGAQAYYGEYNCSPQ